MKTLREANVARNLEWDPDAHITPEFRGNELAGEVGELCNLIKKVARQRMGLRGTRATTAELETEMADVVICVDLIAMQFNIDLWGAVRRKFNQTSNKYGLTTKLTEGRRKAI